MLNSVILIGRLTKDPELRYASSGKAVATMRLAVDRGTVNQQGQRESDFIDVVCWDRLGETVANHLQKGRLIAVQGRLQVRQYTNQEGQRREKAEVVAHTVRFLDGAKGSGKSNGDTAPIGSEVSSGADDPDFVPF